MFVAGNTVIRLTVNSYQFQPMKCKNYIDLIQGSSGTVILTVYSFKKWEWHGCFSVTLSHITPRPK